MGLMDKIDAKLHKDKPTDQHKSSSHDNYDSTTTSSNDHIFSGTKDSKYGGSSTTGSNTYGTHPAVNRDGYGDDTYGSSTTHGSHGQGSHGVSDKLHSSNRSGDYPTESSSRPHDPYSSKGQRMAAGDEYGSSTGGYGSTTSGVVPRTTGSTDYGRSSYEDPSVSRSKHGGITNNPHDPTNDLSSSRHGHGHHGTSAPGYGSGASTGSSHLPGHSSGHHGTSATGYDSGTHGNSAPGYDSGSTTGSSHLPGQSSDHHGTSAPGYDSGAATGNSHNYGRDAGTAGASGGAFEKTKHHIPGMSSSYDQPQSGSHSYPDPTTASRSAGGPMSDSSHGHQQPMGSGVTGPGMSVAGDSGINPARKMGGAYEAGYRDAMEHAKAEMQNQR